MEKPASCGFSISRILALCWRSRRATLRYGGEGNLSCLDAIPLRSRAVAPAPRMKC